MLSVATMERNGLFQSGRPDQFPPVTNVKSTVPFHGSLAVAVTLETTGCGSILNMALWLPSRGGSIVTVRVAVPAFVLLV